MISVSEEPQIPIVLTSSRSSAGVGDSSAPAVQEAVQTTASEESARETSRSSGVKDAAGKVVESQPVQEMPEGEK